MRIPDIKSVTFPIKMRTIGIGVNNIHFCVSKTDDTYWQPVLSTFGKDSPNERYAQPSQKHLEKSQEISCMYSLSHQYLKQTNQQSVDIHNRHINIWRKRK